MTTDLTGDFELGEDEFDWDVFLPDPDDADVESEAAALEDDAELSLDDSDFDWDGALRDDAGPDNGADSDARSGAAYDRIVDTVRRSFDEEPLGDADAQPESGVILEEIATAQSETPSDAEQEYAATGSLRRSQASRLPRLTRMARSDGPLRRRSNQMMNLRRSSTWRPKRTSR